MSQESLALTVDESDELLVLQLRVFERAAAIFEVPAAQRVLGFILANEEARRWALGLLPLDRQTQQLALSTDVALPFIGQATKWGVTALEIVQFLQTYGPQIKALLGMLRPLLDAFKGAGKGQSTGDGPTRPVF